MKYHLLHSVSADLADLADAFAAESVTVARVENEGGLLVGTDPTVFLLNPPDRDLYTTTGLKRFVDGGGAIVYMLADDEPDLPDDVPDEYINAVIPAGYTKRSLLIGLRSAFGDAAARRETIRLRNESAQRTRELGELTEIGIALSTQRDYNQLLALILNQARRLTGSDAGSLYLVEDGERGKRYLRFKLAQNSSRPEIPFQEITMPLDHTSIAGYVVSTSERLIIDDAYFLPPDVEYTVNKSIDQKYGYRTKSMLTIPMTDHKNEVIGALQLINRKRHFDVVLSTPEDFDAEVTPYSHRVVELVSSLASQAAVSIENSQLYEDIERLFEGFVKAAVTAIEQRDPTTFGHSGRVANLTVRMAEAVEHVSTGTYRNLSFDREEIREIRYAALLHDFGKVGVREEVLVKANKLYEADLKAIKERYAFIHRSQERDFFRGQVDFLLEHGQAGFEAFRESLHQKHNSELEDLNNFMRLVLESNQPSLLPEGNFDELMRYADRFYNDIEGHAQPFLSSDETRYLTIRKGSLDEAERLQIQSHVNHTFKFLSEIPWTSELKNVPDIAYGHHEKLNGIGYPRGVNAIDIAPQTRMMTISDIYDALTATDRPYKRAVPVDRALDILGYEVKDGMLDHELYQLFIESKVWEHVNEL